MKGHEMPQAIDLTVKNGATTPVDKTFELINPAAGDGGIAYWALREGTISSVFPSFSYSAYKNVTGKSRIGKSKFRLPSSYTDPVTGQSMTLGSAEMNITVSIPDNFPEALKADFIAYSLNLVNTALMKSALKDAYPTV